ncbi:MAG: MBL fold metallo-hydrolase [Clostridia bacterium]|nr:MBL fold metallo-hydrolase [Clostridia bacterium]
MSLQRIKVLSITLLLIITSLFCGCVQPVTDGDAPKEPPILSGGAEENDSDNKTVYTSLVEFLDVGDGECIIVRFSDGKNLVIDSGAYTKDVTEKVVNKIKERCGENIDYFILTHPDDEHIGNVRTILNNFTVGKIYIPKVLTHLSMLPEYERILNLIEEKKIVTDYSDFYDCVLGDGYSLVFLSPSKKGGSYARFNGSITPSENEVNDLSPIVYLEIDGVRFVLSGDATKTEEQLVIDQNDFNFYNLYLGSEGVTVNLEEVDFLKVSDGGSASGSSNEFLYLLQPQNAIISVSGNNYKDNPDSGVLNRLQVANARYNCYRTDVYGDVGVYITDNGEYIVYTEA